MDCLVTKLKGIVNDDNLRKLNEIEISIEILGTTNDSKSNDSELWIQLNYEAKVRKNREGLDLATDNNKTFKLNNVQSGDKIFISNENNNINDFNIGGQPVLNGFKLFMLKISGVNKLNSLRLSSVIVDYSCLPDSKYLTSFNLPMTYSPSINEKIIIDIENLVKKFPSLNSIQFVGLNYEIKNSSALIQKNGMTSFTAYNINSDNTMNVEDFVNCLTLNCGNVILTGDYFGAINGKEKNYFYCSGTFTYHGETFEDSKLGQIGGDYFYVDGDVDQMLINLANNATKISGGNAIKINSARTSSSDSAINTLQSKGWTISIPGGGSAAAASTMSVMSTMSLIESNEKVESGNYRIAYQENQLIIEPTEFPIYPADGVTVKEFQTLEEANEFISENNLSTEVE